ncbi:hypothetical protein ACHHYP_10774 [Achlya hypogyna]|uniref:3-dehydroquinate dehydratase n=1 Tax=Achlya hypogyna TaxID=1202772 RepID=A0A1V9YKK2_ACHHY|nr:hypothetical protein ACHHYP_10774 [Achlya hypogyna]
MWSVARRRAALATGIRRAFATKKSADDYFLPNLFQSSQPALGQGPPTSIDHGNDTSFDSDIDLLDAELSSILGPLPDRDDDSPYDHSTPSPRPDTTQDTTILRVPPQAPPILRSVDSATPSIAPVRKAGPTVSDIHIINGPCSLVQGNVIAGYVARLVRRPIDRRTQASWPQLEAQLRAAAGSLSVTATHTNHEGSVVDHLLASAASTTVILNAGGLVDKYPAIQRALQLTSARVILINPAHAPEQLSHPALRYICGTSNAVAGMTSKVGFGAHSYELAMQAALRQS